MVASDQTPKERSRVVVANPADGGFCYWLAKLYIFAVFALVALLLASMPAGYLIVASLAPPVPDLRAYRNNALLETKILSADGQLLSTLVDERRYLAELREMNPLLINAFLAAEDRAFFQHGGVDFRGIVRAAIVNFRAGRVRQGGSTITQQVAKSFLSPERTIERKLKEIVLARRLEALYSKREILYLYLNNIFLGERAYGVKAAARVFFNKSLRQLDLGEMALLAGLARAPSRYSPVRNPGRARARRDLVLDLMVDAKYISDKQRREAKAKPIELVTQTDKTDKRWLAPHFAEHIRRDLLERYGGRKNVYGAGLTVSATVDLHLQKLARQRVWTAVKALDKRQGWRGPVMRVHSSAERKEILAKIRQLYGKQPLQPRRPYLTLIERVSRRRARGRIGDRRVEIPLALMRWAYPYSRTNAENEREELESATTALREGDLVWTVSPKWWLRPKSWGKPDEKVTKMALDQIPRVEGAIYSYDHHSGYVLAMIGGLDYDRSTFNRTVQACRQPGSAYKPLFFSLALDGTEYSMASILHDKPYEPEPGEEWNPQNVHGTLDGKVTMHTALIRSLNLPAIQLVNHLGPDKVAKWARRLGYTTPIHADKALALGASCTRTFELTRMFATFARNGTQIDPLYIRQVRDRFGNVIEDHTIAEDPFLPEGDRIDRLWATSRDTPKRVIDARTAFLMTKLLRDSVLLGIAARCRIVPAPTGGKGGTSSDTADVWFVGFTSQWTTAAWIGDDTYQRPLGAKEASYTSVIPMWANYMKHAVGKRPHKELPAFKPTGLRSATIDAKTGKPPTPTTEKTVQIFYRPGTYHPERENN